MSQKSSRLNHFDDRDLVLVGAQEHAVAQLPQLPARIKPTYLYADGPVKLEAHGFKIIDDLDGIRSLRNPFILIARSPSPATPGPLSLIVENLRRLGVEYEHIDHLVKGAVINTGLMKRMKKESSIDASGNCVRIGAKTSDKFFITFRRNGQCNSVALDDTHIMSKVQIDFYGSDANVTIGSGTTFVSTFIDVGHRGSVSIGEDCMFSHGIVLGQTDQHPIFDAASGKRINYGKPITIGNHVWVGRDAMLLSGFGIGDGGVVGARSVTSSRFRSNVVIAGSPAAELRQGVTWARDTLASEQIDHVDQCEDKMGLHWLQQNAPS
ncbi:acyltransferase [Burkholderia multivorans]|nr:acyltransferase [Burkholderia multivorans]